MLACFALGAVKPPPAPRIIAVGDLHGDFQAWTQIATASGILGPDGHWAGGATTLVQLGDITDRGPDSLKIVRSLQQLQAEAPQANGRVIVVLGNHEAMNLLGDNRYTTPGEYAAFVDDRSVARRERLYAAVRKQLESMTPLGRAGTPEEAAGAVYLLCTPEANYITGQVVMCDGGF